MIKLFGKSHVILGECEKNIYFKNIIIILFIIIGAMIWGKINRKEKKNLIRQRDKFLDFYQLASHWIEEKNYGKSSWTYFDEMNYRKIAIYGMGEFANRLMEELKESDVEVMYGIDRDVCNSAARIQNVYSINDCLPQVDVVVVTPFYEMKSIKEKLEKKLNCPIISLEEVIWSI